MPVRGLCSVPYQSPPPCSLHSGQLEIPIRLGLEPAEAYSMAPGRSPQNG